MGVAAAAVYLHKTSRPSRRATSARSKFLVLLSLMGALLAWRAARVAPRNKHVSTATPTPLPAAAATSPIPLGENRSSAFVIRRGASTAAAAAARRAETSRAAEAEEAIQRAESLVVPGLGEGGAPGHLEGEEALQAELLMATEAFNKMLSDRIALDRNLTDVRHSLCRRDWREEDLLGSSASVVIVFHNEPRSTLLRTVHSVVSRSPPHLLKEVILVDDFSSRAELQYELDHYLDSRFPGLVRLLRLPRRWGLVKARLVGAHAAKGEVLVFLDAHCEVTDQWLEPLLEHVREDRSSVAVPVIDVLHSGTLAYEPRGHDSFRMGGFTWDGHFDWLPVPPSEQQRRGSPANVTRTPVMPGGLFAINRQYFWEIGSYDEQMGLWGGENLEMSFRIWMCGGSVMLVPCSRVGHIFRRFSPYSLPGDPHGHNTARLAHVWMDEYKRIFFLNRPDLRDTRPGDLTSRVELRRRLQCRSFRWYLEHVYPGKLVTDEHVHAYGKVRPRRVNHNMCLQRLPRASSKEFYLGVAHCSRHQPHNQIFALSLRGELRWNEDCAEVERNLEGGSAEVVLRDCHLETSARRHQWEHTKDSQVRHTETGLCLAAPLGSQIAAVSAQPCTTHDKTQIWTFENSYNVKNKLN